MRVLLLGSSGFLGRHLAGHLLARGDSVEGWCRSGVSGDARVRTRRVDLLRPDTYAKFEGPWDAAVLLAGHTVPGDQWTLAMVDENAAISSRALAHLARTSPGMRVVVLSSSHVYGKPRHGEALEESARIEPAGPYGLSKIAVEDCARAQMERLDVVIARSFNQIGPAMARGLLVPDLTSALLRGDDPVRMRGADAERDFTDARDGVRALAALLDVRCERGEVFNVCSGRALRISRLASGLAVRHARARSTRQVEIVFEPGEMSRFVGSSEKLTRATGWRPEIDLESTLDWISQDFAPGARG